MLLIMDKVDRKKLKKLKKLKVLIVDDDLMTIKYLHSVLGNFIINSEKI